MEQIRIKSNTGRIVIDKTITNFPESPESSRYVIDKNGKIIERKKKGRLYSLGGNEPKRQSHLVRMKTVGTFDLCMDVTAIACGFNQDILPVQEAKLEPKLESVEDEEEKSLQADLNSISPKRQRNISSSENSLTLDDSSINSNTKKKFRSLSTSSYLVKQDSDEFRSKSADVLDTKADVHELSFEERLATAASAADIRHDSEMNIYEPFKNESEAEIKAADDEFLKTYKSTSSSIPVSVRRRTFRKSKKIVRTDSELFKEQIILQDVESSPIKTASLSAQTSKESSLEDSEKFAIKNSSKNISNDTVFSDTAEEQLELEKLETEYNEHVKSSLQREYKSDGDSLDEVGKDRRRRDVEWRNQSVDFEFLENEKADKMKADLERKKSYGKKIRTDSESRTRSEGDKDTLYMKNDSTETQSTEDENKIEVDPQAAEPNKVEKHQSLFEKRFGKLKKMNKLLKVKRFSTSALYDKRKVSEPAVKTKEAQQQQPPFSALSQVTDFASSKTSLASPKSLKGKRFMLKKRKFSFFGKSQSNNDLNINLKSIASKLSLLSKSNFDLSKNSSNLRLNAVGIYGKYGAGNEYRSDIIQKQGCTSPLSEAFYNATGSYQLTPMELFEKFCSQDFTGLYKHEPISELEDEAVLDSHAYKTALKKSSSLRKATLLKQNSEPKFGKNYPIEQYFTKPQDAFEEEESEGAENEEDDEFEYNHVVGRKLAFDQNDQYYEDNEDLEVYSNEADEDIDEIYLMPEKHRYEGGYLRNSDEILAIDETDEEILDDSEDLLEEIDANADLEYEIDPSEKEKLLTLYEICPQDDELSESCDENGKLKTIISEYVKNACASAASERMERSKSLDLLSNSSETLKSNSNSEYAFDTVKQINLDSCSTSKLSLSLNSDIFDDITLAAPVDSAIKTIKICEMDDFTLTPDGSTAETNNEGRVLAIAQVSEQEKIKNELQSQYTIIDCDELEHDGEDEMQRLNDEKSSFAEALNKEFDKLFSRVVTDSDTDLTTTPSGATVVTAIKMPSRCSMEKLEALPFEFDHDTVAVSVSAEKEKAPIAAMSQSMTSTTLHQSMITKKDESAKDKSKRSHSLGAIHKKKSNKCTPL